MLSHLYSYEVLMPLEITDSSCDKDNRAETGNEDVVKHSWTLTDISTTEGRAAAAIHTEPNVVPKQQNNVNKSSMFQRFTTLSRQTMFS